MAAKLHVIHVTISDGTYSISQSELKTLSDSVTGPEVQYIEINYANIGFPKVHNPDEVVNLDASYPKQYVMEVTEDQKFHQLNVKFFRSSDYSPSSFNGVDHTWRSPFSETDGFANFLATEVNNKLIDRNADSKKASEAKLGITGGLGTSAVAGAMQIKDGKHVKPEHGKWKGAISYVTQSVSEVASVASSKASGLLDIAGSFIAKRVETTKTQHEAIKDEASKKKPDVIDVTSYTYKRLEQEITPEMREEKQIKEAAKANEIDEEKSSKN
ncbi:MAG: hypothetical protein ACPGUD_02170 [Parashewanella sp.]